MKPSRLLKRLTEWVPAHWPAFALYGIAACAVVVFGLFYFVGYENPFIDDPQFNEPRFTDVLLVFVFLLIAATLVAVGISVGKTARHSLQADGAMNGIPRRKIAWCVAGGTLLSLVLSFVFGSAKPLGINAQVYADGAWLRTADMFIATSGLLIILAIVAVAVATGRTSRSNRKHR